jgi:kanosamine 6-kinase
MPDRHHLGIDIGGTKVALRLEGAGGQAREAGFRWGPPAGAGPDLELLAGKVGALRAGLPGAVGSVGVALPATLDGGGRVTTWPGRPSWAGFGLAAALRRAFPGAAVTCADDGDLAALAEARHADTGHLAYLGVGTGIGGGLILGGRPCPALARGSAEPGHVVISQGGPRCDCGRRGCVQAIASGPATLRRASALAAREIGFAELRDACQDGLPWAGTAVGESCAALAALVISLGELVRPDVVLIGGGFAAGIPGFAARVAAAARLLARPGHPSPPVRPAVLGARSSLYGAVLLARQPGLAGPVPDHGGTAQAGPDRMPPASTPQAGTPPASTPPARAPERSGVGGAES